MVGEGTVIGLTVLLVVGLEADAVPVALDEDVLVALVVVVLLVLVDVDVDVGTVYVGEALGVPWPRLFLMLSNCEYG